MTLFCAGCRSESEFEQPPCADGHGSDCPDLVCVRCGLALFAFVSDDLIGSARRTVRERARAG